MPHTKRYNKHQKVSALQISYSDFFLTTWRNIPLGYALFLNRSPQLPRLPCRISGARGETAVFRAANGGHAAVVELLLSAGARVDAATHDGRGLGKVFRSFLGLR